MVIDDTRKFLMETCLNGDDEYLLQSGWEVSSCECIWEAKNPSSAFGG